MILQYHNIDLLKISSFIYMLKLFAIQTAVSIQLKVKNSSATLEIMGLMLRSLGTGQIFDGLKNQWPEISFRRDRSIF